MDLSSEGNRGGFVWIQLDLVDRPLGIILWCWCLFKHVYSCRFDRVLWHIATAWWWERRGLSTMINDHGNNSWCPYTTTTTMYHLTTKWHPYLNFTTIHCEKSLSRDKIPDVVIVVWSWWQIGKLGPAHFLVLLDWYVNKKILKKRQMFFGPKG